MKQKKQATTDLSAVCSDIAAVYSEVYKWANELKDTFRIIEIDQRLLLGDYFLRGSKQRVKPCNIYFAIDFMDVVSLCFPTLNTPYSLKKADMETVREWRSARLAGLNKLFFGLSRDFYPLILLPPYITERSNFQQSLDYIQYRVSDEFQQLNREIKDNKELRSWLESLRTSSTKSNAAPRMNWFLMLERRFPWLMLALGGGFQAGYQLFRSLPKKIIGTPCISTKKPNSIPTDIWEAIIELRIPDETWSNAYGISEPEKATENDRPSSTHETYIADARALTMVQQLNIKLLASQLNKYSQVATLPIMILVSGAESMSRAIDNNLRKAFLPDIRVKCYDPMREPPSDCLSPESRLDTTSRVTFFRPSSTFRAFAAVFGERTFSDKASDVSPEARKKVLTETILIRKDINTLLSNTQSLERLVKDVKSGRCELEKAKCKTCSWAKSEESLRSLHKVVSHLNQARERMMKTYDFTSWFSARAQKFYLNTWTKIESSIDQTLRTHLQILLAYLKQPDEYINEISGYVARLANDVALSAEAVRILAALDYADVTKRQRFFMSFAEVPFYVVFQPESEKLVVKLSKIVHLCSKPLSNPDIDCIQYELNDFITGLTTSVYWSRDTNETIRELDRDLAFLLFLVVEKRYWEVIRIIDRIYPGRNKEDDLAKYSKSHPQFYWEMQLLRMRAVLKEQYGELEKIQQTRRLEPKDMRTILYIIQTANSTYKRFQKNELKPCTGFYRFLHTAVAGAAFHKELINRYPNAYGVDWVIKSSDEIIKASLETKTKNAGRKKCLKTESFGRISFERAVYNNLILALIAKRQDSSLQKASKIASERLKVDKMFARPPEIAETLGTLYYECSHMNGIENRKSTLYQKKSVKYYRAFVESSELLGVKNKFVDIAKMRVEEIERIFKYLKQLS